MSLSNFLLNFSSGFFQFGCILSAYIKDIFGVLMFHLQSKTITDRKRWRTCLVDNFI
jgi:hypothetical protein